MAKVNLWRVILGILGAAVGVQSKRQLELDKGEARAFYYIVGGIIFTLLFVLLMIFLARFMINFAG